MKQQKINKIAAGIFERNPELDVAFITSDGFGFINKNSAELHKNTNALKKKLTLYTVKKSELTLSNQQNDVKTMSKPELQDYAKTLGIDFKSKDTKPELLEKIQKVLSLKVSSDELEDLKKQATSRGLTVEEDDTTESLSKKIQHYDSTIKKRA